jgi:hypothetical protein
MRKLNTRAAIALAVVSAFLAIAPGAMAADPGTVEFTGTTETYMPTSPTITWMTWGGFSSAQCQLSKLGSSPSTPYPSTNCTTVLPNAPTVNSTSAPAVTSYSWDLSTLAGGDGIYRVTYTAAFTSYPAVTATRDFVVDTVTPTITASAPTGVTNDNTPQISYQPQDANLDRTECAMDPVDPLNAAEYSVCPASPFSTAPLADGDHKIYIVAYDKLGRLAVVVKGFTIDATGPAIIVTGLSEGEVLTSAWPPLSVSTSDPGTGVMSSSCNYDSNAPTDCGNSGFLNAPLPDGPHRLNVVATDVIGNVSTRTINFTIDTSGGLKQGLIAPRTAKFGVKRGKLKSGKYATTLTVSFAMPAGSTATSCSGSAKLSAAFKKKQLASASPKFKQSGAKCVGTAKLKLSKKFKGKKLLLKLAYKSGPIKAFTLSGTSKL